MVSVIENTNRILEEKKGEPALFRGDFELNLRCSANMSEASHPIGKAACAKP